jgi:choline kinase
MVGVIIAAGRGGRLSSVTGGMPKTLLSLHGKPIIQWIIDGARNAGIEEFVIVVGFEREKIVEYFNKNHQDGISIVFNQRWECGNGISVLAAQEAVKGRGEFILMMSDHLFEKNLLEIVLESDTARPTLAVEQDLNKVFDIDDATKVNIVNGRIMNIGKDLSEYNGVDAGLFILDESIFEYLQKSIDHGLDSLTGGIREMVKSSTLYAYPIPDEVYWIDIDSEDTFHRAIEMWRKK